MFAVKLKQIYFTSYKILVKNLRNSGKRLETEIVASNPGLNKRLKAFQEDGIKIQDEDAEEIIEHSESNFYQVGETYNDHLSETLIGKHELRHHIIKEKYFKMNMPNLLTWSEKEQIRHLANTEPHEWTPQRISESFPITEHAVRKLIKYPWKPASEERIARHDASAMRNWRELKEGTLDIPEDLRQHFLKFSDRTIPPLKKTSVKIDLTPNEDLGEFERIIRRCAEKETNSQSNESTDKRNVENISEDTNVKVRKDGRKLTLEELTTKIKNRLDKGKKVEMTDKMIVDCTSVKKEENTPTHTTEIDFVKESKEDKHLTEFKENNDAVFYNINYAERIRIPKKAYKKGATYKVNDCFYDDDGRFLYRVIGLTKS